MCFHAARQPDVAAQEGGKRKTVPLHRVEILPAFPKGFLPVARQPAHTGRCQARQDKPSRPPLRPPGHPFTVRIGHSLFRSRRETLRRHAETENDRGGIRIAPHRPEPLCVPVRFRGTVEDRHPRLPERKLHARPLHERNRKLHGAQPGHFQTGLCQGQRPDPAKVDYQTPSGSRPRLDTIRKEKSDGSLFRCGIQKPVALL